MKIIDGSNYLKEVKQLIIEYTTFLNRDLSFQNLSDELEHLKEKYTKPNGELLVAITEIGEVVGCVAFYEHTRKRCEMKRLYVKKEYRNHKIGYELVKNIIELARKDGYKEMVLDTIQPLKSAIHLYRKCGFREIESYYENPMEDVIYMGMKL